MYVALVVHSLCGCSVCYLRAPRRYQAEQRAQRDAREAEVLMNEYLRGTELEASEPGAAEQAPTALDTKGKGDARDRS